MTSHPTIQTCSQSCALEEHQEVLNVPSTSTSGNELMEEGEFLSFSNHHTPIGTAPADPSTPTPAPHLPNSSGIYSAEDRFANTIPIPDYVCASWMSGGGGGGDSNLPLPGPPSIPLPNSPAPSNNMPTPDPLLLFTQPVQALLELPWPLQTATPHLERPRSVNQICSMELIRASSAHSSCYVS